MEHELHLCDLPVGSMGKVTRLLAIGLPRRRMLDLGLIPGTKVECIRHSPLGDPTAFNIRGAIIALRYEESQQVLIKPL